MAEDFLKTYYDDEERKKLSPIVMFQGTWKAVIRLQRSSTRGQGSVGYVLIDKRGNSKTSQHVPLHDGPATPVQLRAMKKKMQEVDTL
jgi:hypothetical protein